jgi:hypothetical protein
MSEEKDYSLSIDEKSDQARLAELNEAERKALLAKVFDEK